MESFYEAFNRFKELLRKCPHHGIPTWELVKAFYDGLTPEDVRDLISTTNGTFLTNNEEVDWQYLERMSVTSKRQAQARRKSKGAPVKALDYEAEERIEKLKQQNLVLERQVAQLTLGQGSEAKAANTFPICTDCGEIGHLVLDCPGQTEKTEVVNQVYGERKQYDMNSNTYHPGLRNHPNFSYGNAANQSNPNFQGTNQGGQSQQNRQQGNYQQGGYNQGNRQGNYQGGQSSGDASLKDTLMEFMKEMRKDKEIRDKEMRALTKQVGQLAEDLTAIRRDPGKLPSTTTVNPAHQSSNQVHINAVSILNDGVGLVENERHLTELNALTKQSNFLKNFGPKVKDTGVENNTIPFPAALKDLKNVNVLYKKDPPSKTMLNTDVNVASSIDFPQKLEDPGTPLISIQVGDLKIDKALLDFGAGVNILPGSLYDQYDFGPLQKVNTTAVLADSSSKLPRGMVTNVIVKVEDFYYLADFMVLDSEPNNSKKQPTVLLGRPFLATIKATINCFDGSVDISCGDQKKRLQVFSDSVELLDEIDGCFSFSSALGKEENTEKFGFVNNRLGTKKGYHEVVVKKGKQKVKKVGVREPP